MKLGRFEYHGKTFHRIMEGDEVLELRGSPFAEYSRTDNQHKLNALKTLISCAPSNFYCADLN